MYASVYVYIYIYIYIYNVFGRVYLCVHMWGYIYVCVCVSSHFSVYVCILWVKYVCTHIYVYIRTYSRGVMVIIVGNGHGDTSSNPGRD